MGGISLVSSSGMNSWWLLDEWWCCGGWGIGGCCGCVGEWGLMWECQRVVYSAYKPFKNHLGAKWQEVAFLEKTLQYSSLWSIYNNRSFWQGKYFWKSDMESFSPGTVHLRNVFQKGDSKSLVSYECGCASPFSFTRWWIWKIIFPIHLQFIDFQTFVFDFLDAVFKQVWWVIPSTIGCESHTLVMVSCIFHRITLNNSQRFHFVQTGVAEWMCVGFSVL